MKKTMMFAIMLLIAIVLMVSFDVRLPVRGMDTSVAPAMPDMLYVCPAASGFWDSLSNGFSHFRKPIVMGFFFGAMILTSVWLWALYQNLLKDKFNRDSFKNPWAFTKLLFWAVIIIYLIMMTPNYFRSVHLTMTNGNWVLCENTSPNAKAVPAGSVEPKKVVIH